MQKVLVIYYSQTGKTKEMALLIGEGITSCGSACEVKEVSAVAAEDLKNYDGIIIGSPTYYGSMSAQIKKLLDESVRYHAKLDGKVGGAFSSSANVAGGNETTIWSILNALLIHGMIIQGDPVGSHFGPVLVAGMDDRVKKECARFAQRFTKLLGSVAKGA